MLSHFVQFNIWMYFILWVTTFSLFFYIVYFTISLFFFVSLLQIFKIFAIKTKKLLRFCILLIPSIPIISNYILFQPLLNFLLLLLNTSTFHIFIRNFFHIDIRILKTSSSILSQNGIFLTQSVNNLFLVRHWYISQLFH